MNWTCPYETGKVTNHRIPVRAIPLLVLALLGVACSTPAPGLRQKTANYIVVVPNETDRLQMTVTQNSLALTGYLEVSIKQPDGTHKVRRTEIGGDVSTDGVPATITIPSRTCLAVSDLTLACFFDQSLNLRLVGDNNRRFPRRLAASSMNGSLGDQAAARRRSRGHRPVPGQDEVGEGDKLRTIQGWLHAHLRREKGAVSAPFLTYAPPSGRRCYAPNRWASVDLETVDREGGGNK